jgi:hypothetical protein
MDMLRFILKNLKSVICNSYLSSIIGEIEKKKINGGCPNKQNAHPPKSAYYICDRMSLTTLKEQIH